MLRNVLFISTAKKQQDADDEARPVGVEAGVENALVDDGEGQRAQDDADDRAVSAGEQHAADDHRDDRVEDEGLPGGHLSAVVENSLGHAHEGGAQAAAHEQRDRQPVRRDAGVARAHSCRRRSRGSSCRRCE